MISIGQKIKEARRAKGLTQVQLGIELGIGQARVWQYETGLRTPKLPLLISIAETLNVSIDWLSKDEEDIKEDFTINELQSDKNPETSFGTRLTAAREKKKMTLEELANNVNESCSIIQMYENNTCMPILEQFKRIAIILEVDYIWLITGAESYFSTSIYHNTHEDSSNELFYYKGPAFAGKRILAIRLTNNYSLESLSTNSGISINELEYYEEYHKIINPEIEGKIANALNVPYMWIENGHRDMANRFDIEYVKERISGFRYSKEYLEEIDNYVKSLQSELKKTK